MRLPPSAQRNIRHLHDRIMKKLVIIRTNLKKLVLIMTRCAMASTEQPEAEHPGTADNASVPQSNRILTL